MFNPVGSAKRDAARATFRTAEAAARATVFLICSPICIAYTLSFFCTLRLLNIL
jgi:hypothetical protein